MKFLVCLIGSLAFGAAVAGEDIDERQDADRNGDVEVSNVSGEVRVTGWDEDVIEITGELITSATRNPATSVPLRAKA